MDVATYLALEEQGQIRHEYVAGEVYAMPGGTFRHMRIVGNIHVKLATAARGGPCSVYTDNAKVRPSDEVFYYPDVVSICTAHDQESVFTASPCLIVEVTSPSTARIDRGEKLHAYLSIPTLRAYLIVDQHKRRVTHYWRDGGDWRTEDLIGHGVVRVPCPDVTLSIDEIYDGVEFPKRVSENYQDEMSEYLTVEPV